MDATQQPPRTLWHDAAVAAYMRTVRRFKETLFALVHLSAGGPARGTEITSVQYKNSAEGVGHWGVFLDRGLVSFVSTYHKGYDFTKKVKAIHRYVPREPAPDEQEEDSEEEDDGNEEGDDADGDNRIRRVLKEQTSRYMAAALGTKAWRQQVFERLLEDTFRKLGDGRETQLLRESGAGTIVR
ncbi:hypothetical protein J4E91_010679 [Alternaria rosae]|nr:hypothetical protein J4E91_010679 [Alternaria rosae]